MLLYSTSKSQFLKDISSNNIEDILQDKFAEILHRNVGRSEYMSWQNSLKEMYFVLQDTRIPDDAGVCLEYNIPGSSKRIDCIITGRDDEWAETLIIIELKQWQDIELTDKDAVVLTRFEHGLKETAHPSYQAWTYAMLLKGFNQVVYEEGIELRPCAFLHNYKDDGKISHQVYQEHIDRAPIFLKTDKQKLSEFISQYIKKWDTSNLMERIEHGKIRPSKALADSLGKMIKGNQEFIMIDEQKVVYETCLTKAKKSTELNKNVIIIEGWPGTGKSVVAINLLVELNRGWYFSQYVTKNSAPRAVYESKLTGTLKKSEFSQLFRGSGSYVDVEDNKYDALIVDEAHRLNEKSGMFSNLGENQIKEIISASKCSVFFIDEDQKVTFKDIGTKDEIKKWAQELGARVTELELSSQFRCNGSDGYLSWLDNSLQIRETANPSLEGIDYDFQVFDDPNALRDAIFEKNQINNKARLVAGYCWDWVSRNNSELTDVNIVEHNFGMKWNLASDGMLWIISPESVNEIGCIHTCQWLEMDYVGVILGDDIIVRDGEVLVNPAKRASTDASLKWYKTAMRTHSEATKISVKEIIKNTYRTLMTRWMKGCYIYSTDKETSEYFKNIR